MTEDEALLEIERLRRLAVVQHGSLATTKKAVGKLQSPDTSAIIAVIQSRLKEEYGVEVNKKLITTMLVSFFEKLETVYTYSDFAVLTALRFNINGFRNYDFILSPEKKDLFIDNGSKAYAGDGGASDRSYLNEFENEVDCFKAGMSPYSIAKKVEGSLMIKKNSKILKGLSS